MAVKQIQYNNNNFNINYEILNAHCEDTIIFLHGWGSNKELMKQAFGTYFKDKQHIYIDMPGFGKSIDDFILTTKDYGKIIDTFISYFDIKKETLIVAGHSFGGKVATLLNPHKLVLISSAGIVEDKSSKTLLTIRIAKIFNKFGLNKVTKLLRSNDVQSMSENMYETFKNVVDEDFSSVFKKHKKETLLLWGDDDTATTLSSAKTINNLIEKSSLKVYNGDHYAFLKHTSEMVKEIENWNI